MLEAGDQQRYNTHEPDECGPQHSYRTDVARPQPSSGGKKLAQAASGEAPRCEWCKCCRRLLSEQTSDNCVKCGKNSSPRSSSNSEIHWKVEDERSHRLRTVHKTPAATKAELLFPKALTFGLNSLMRGCEVGCFKSTDIHTISNNSK